MEWGRIFAEEKARLELDLLRNGRGLRRECAVLAGIMVLVIAACLLVSTVWKVVKATAIWVWRLQEWDSLSSCLFEGWGGFLTWFCIGRYDLLIRSRTVFPWEFIARNLYLPSLYLFFVIPLLQSPIPPSTFPVNQFLQLSLAPNSLSMLLHTCELGSQIPDTQRNSTHYQDRYHESPCFHQHLIWSRALLELLAKVWELLELRGPRGRGGGGFKLVS
jgi:hypothetical protein